MRKTTGSILAVAAFAGVLVSSAGWEGRQRNEQVIEQMLIQSGWLNAPAQAAKPAESTIQISKANRQADH